MSAPQRRHRPTNRDYEPAQEPVAKSKHRWYVTIIRGRRVGYLLGPYGSHLVALLHVARGMALAIAADPFAHFDIFGTASRPDSRKTVFGR